MSYMLEFSKLITSAIERCDCVGKSESLLGYADSAEVYFTMRDEMHEVRHWLAKEFLKKEIY